MTVTIDVLGGLPPEVHDLMERYLRPARKMAVSTAERVSLEHPLPWDPAFADRVFAIMLDEFNKLVRKTMPLLPDAVIAAMHRQLLVSFTGRLDELSLAAGCDTIGDPA